MLGSFKKPLEEKNDKVKSSQSEEYLAPVLGGLITPTSCHGQLHRLNTLSPLTSALGSEALYEAGVQVSRGQWLLFSENLLAGYV